MMDDIICPNCGESNPADLPFCRNCQWRLHPHEDAWQDRPTKELGSDRPASSDEGAPAEPIPDWLKGLQNAQPAPPTPRMEARQPRAPEPPREDDLLAGLASQQKPEQQEVPEWVARIMGLNPATDSVDEAAAGDIPAPASLSAEVAGETSELIDRLGAEQIPPPERASDEQAAASWGAIEELPAPTRPQDDEINEWLKHLDESAVPHGPPISLTPRSATTDVPTWVDRMTGVADASSAANAKPEATVPEWLIEARRESGPEQTAAEEPSDATAADATMESESSAAERADAQRRPVPPFMAEDLARLDVDALFASMQMPEWLADADRSRSGQVELPPPTLHPDQEIEPADLPSWVEAMKPGDAALPTVAPVPAPAAPENRGPLLGLRGVLPALPGAGAPSAKPRSHSMKLDVSDQQRAHSAMLEEMLAAESRPLPMMGNALLASQRLLRWGISAVMLALVGASVLSGSRTFALPSIVPIESNAAIQTVQSIPPDAAVLAVFDYEPALAGEMEAAAASLMDHMLLLRHPRLALISTSPVGSMLAEHFIAGVLADRNYTRGQQYANLGYLPGGLTGVQLFVQDPAGTIPLGAGADRVWELPPLTGAHRLSDFAAIVVLTDSLEGGRVWIEQTEGARGSTPLIVVSSAQAGPMLIPYFNSGQVAGLVSGLNGAAGAEQANGGLPGLVRSYWDAYSLGMYAGAALLVFGAAWNFWIGLRERQQEMA